MSGVLKGFLASADVVRAASSTSSSSTMNDDEKAVAASFTFAPPMASSNAAPAPAKVAETQACVSSISIPLESHGKSSFFESLTGKNSTQEARSSRLAPLDAGKRREGDAGARNAELDGDGGRAAASLNVVEKVSHGGNKSPDDGRSQDAGLGRPRPRPVMVHSFRPAAKKAGVLAHSAGQVTSTSNATNHGLSKGAEQGVQPAFATGKAPDPPSVGLPSNTKNILKRDGPTTAIAQNVLPASDSKRARLAEAGTPDLIGLDKVASVIEEHRRHQLTLELKNAALSEEVQTLRQLVAEKEKFAANLKSKTRELVGKAAQAMEASGQMEKAWRETRGRMTGLLGTCDVKLQDVKYIRSEYDELVRRPGGVNEALAKVPALEAQLRELSGSLQNVTQQHEMLRQYQAQAINQARFDHAGAVEQLKDLTQKQGDLEQARLGLTQDLSLKQQELEKLRAEHQRALQDARQENARAAELDDRRVAYETQLRDLKQEELSLQQRLSVTGVKLATYQGRVEKADEQRLALEAHLARQERSLAQEVEQRKTLEAHNQALKQELIQLQAAKEAAECAQSEIKAAETAAYERYHGLLSSASFHKQSCEHLLAENSKLKEELACKARESAEADDTRAALDDARSQLGSFEERLKKALGEHGKWQAKVQSLEKDRSDLQTRHEQSQSDLVRAKEEIARAQEQTAEMRQKQEASAASWSERDEALRGVISEHKVKLDQVQAQLKRKESELEREQGSVQNAQQQRTALEARLAASDNSLQRAQAATNSVTAALAKSEDQRHELRTQVRDLKEAAAAHALRYQEVNDQATILQTRILREERALQQAEARHSESENRVLALEQDVEALRRQIEDLQAGATEPEESGESVLARFRSGNLVSIGSKLDLDAS